MPDYPAEAVSLDLPATTGEVTGSGPGEYLGYTLRETSGTAVAKVVLYDNATSAAGEILDEISLASGGQLDLEHDRPGKQVVNGVYASITGAVQGAILQ